MENLQEVMKTVFTKEEYKKQIEEAILKKVIESINWKLNEKIYEIVNQHFDATFKVGIEEELKKADGFLRTTILETIKTKMMDVASRIEFQPYEWDFQKLVKESIKIKDKK